MSVDIQTIVLDAIRETLRVAKCQAEKQRPIDNINADSICNRFFTEKEEQMCLSTNSNVYWLTAFIECNGPLENSAELDAVIEKIKSGCTSSSGQCVPQGQHIFDVACS